MHGRFEAVLFDWRGTLVTTPTLEQWVREAMRRLGRASDAGEVEALAGKLAAAETELDGPGVDSDADLHRRTYRATFRRLGIDDELAGALYAVESDPAANPFAADARETLRALRGAGLRLGVVSDIHIDLRPAFTAAGLADAVDVFTLSFEQRMQKPDPRMFTRTMAALGSEPATSLMVGDRSRPDGAAVEAGLTTLLLPPLTDPEDRRLQLVTALCGLA